MQDIVLISIPESTITRIVEQAVNKALDKRATLVANHKIKNSLNTKPIIKASSERRSNGE